MAKHEFRAPMTVKRRDVEVSNAEVEGATRGHGAGLGVTGP